jgi:recA bacterial DNA recombination protein
MPGLLHASETAANVTGAPMPPPGASALERLRGKLSQPLDPGDPLSSLAPLVDSLRSASEYGRAVQESSRETPTSPRRRAAPLKTFPALDELLGGGLPRGKLVEMIGARSSGRFSMVLAAVAAATTAGEAAALVDLGDGLDPEAAAALGADLRRLLWLRPGTLKQALAGAEILLGGGFPMVALDLGNPPVRGGRGHEAGWLRLARAAQAQGAALLVASPYRVSGTAAAAVLQAARGRARWQGTAAGPCRLLDGLSCRVTLEKCRGRRLPAGSLGLELRLSPIVPEVPASPAIAATPAAALAPAAIAAPAAAVAAAAAGQAGRT